MKILLIGTLVLVGIATSFYLIKNPDVAKRIQGQASEQSTIPTDGLLLPDLFIQTPRNIYIYGSGTNKKLRFASSYGNKGRGPLELLGHSDPITKLTTATQKIRKTDGTSITREVGQFVFHPDHKHWHIDNYVIYQLWSLKDDSRDQLVATTNKQSVCLWDQNSNDLKLPGAPKKRVYPFPCDKVVQGFSVGWGDTYNANFAGQEISISSISDGDYLLRNIVNPEQNILELDSSNNTGEVKITISRNRVTIK